MSGLAYSMSNIPYRTASDSNSQRYVLCFRRFFVRVYLLIECELNHRITGGEVVTNDVFPILLLLRMKLSHVDFGFSRLWYVY